MVDRGFPGATPLVATALTQSAPTSSPSSSIFRTNPFAAALSHTFGDTKASHFSLASSSARPSEPFSSSPPADTHQRVPAPSAGADSQRDCRLSRFFAGMWGTSSTSTPALSVTATRSMHAAAAAQQDDRFPVNFDLPPTPRRADGAVLLPQPSRSGSDDDKKKVAASSERKARSLAAPPAQAPAQRSPVTARAAERFEELPYCYEAFKEQMRTYPCLQEIKHQVRAFVTRYMHKVAPDGELVAEVAQFISQISTKFAACEVWKDKPAELDRAIEGLEHFVCLNLYNVLFSPQLSDDSDKDKLLFDRVTLLRFIEGKHLDLPPDCCRPDRIEAAAAAIAELDKLKTPREKLASICTAGTILRDMLRHPTVDREQLFLSALVLATLRAQPKHLFSNLQFVRRFRNPMKMTADEQYYLMHLNGAVEYLEKVQPQWLSIEPEEFVASVNKSIDSLGSDSPSSSRRTLTRSSAASPTLGSVTSGTASSTTLTAVSTKSGAESASQITPTANAHPPWRTASSAASVSSSTSTTSTFTVKASVSRSSTSNRNTPASVTLSASAGSSATRSSAADSNSNTATNTSTSTSSLAVSLNSEWCDIGTELFLVHSAPHCEVPRSLASLVPAPAPAPSACSASSGIASDLADLDPIGQASCTADPDSLSLHSLAWGTASPADPPPRSRTASMRSALSHQSTDVAQCHAADLAAFGPAAVSSSSSSSSTSAAHSHAHTTTTSSAATSSPGRPSRVAPPPPLDPYRDGGIQQLLAAAAEPPVDKFLQCDIEALSMSDIPLLLSDYKRLAALNASLSRILRLTAP